MDGLQLACLLCCALGLELALGVGGVHTTQELLGVDAVADLGVEGLDRSGERGGQGKLALSSHRAGCGHRADEVLFGRSGDVGGSQLDIRGTTGERVIATTAGEENRREGSCCDAESFLLHEFLTFTP